MEGVLAEVCLLIETKNAPEKLFASPGRGENIIADAVEIVESSHSEPYQLVLSAENRLEITVSPDGAKLLAERNREDGMLIRLSVLDMSADRFTSIGRDPSAVGNEHRADWFDENTVLVDNNTYDAAGNNAGESWYYLYRIGA